MEADLERRTRSAVADAYASVTRLRVYMRLALLTSALFFLANLGGMIVGWLPIDVGVLGLVAAALTATVTVGKGYESVHRTTLYAMELEQTLPGDEDLDTSSAMAQSVKTLSGVALIVSVVLGAGIVGYSITNADTQQPVTSLSDAFIPEDERDDDDGDDGDEQEDTDDGGEAESESEGDGPGDDPAEEQGEQPGSGGGATVEDDEEPDDD